MGPDDTERRQSLGIFEFDAVVFQIFAKPLRSAVKSSFFSVKKIFVKDTCIINASFYVSYGRVMPSTMHYLVTL